MCTEVNVKELDVVSADNKVFLKRVEPDFKKLGPKLGKAMKAAAAAIKALDAASIAELETGGCITINVDGTDYQITTDDVRIISENIEGWMVANEGDLTVALDITVTDELAAEGLAREIVNRVQNMRKARNFDITDHITLGIVANAEVDKVLASFGDYIAGQVLADSIVSVPTPGQDFEAVNIDGLELYISVSRC